MCGHGWPWSFWADLNGQGAPVIHGLMLISVDTSHSLSILYLFVLDINGAYITSLKPRTDYSFVQNGSDVKGATWEPDECLPISLDHIRLRLKLDWVETLFQYLTARNTTFYFYMFLYVFMLSLLILFV